MEIEDLPFPLKTYEELKKLSKEELEIYKIELMADMDFICGIRERESDISF